MSPQWRSVRTRSGAIVASIVVAVAGSGIWQAATNGWGFSNKAVVITAPSTATGSVTLSAKAPPSTSSVTFYVDASSVGTDSTSPYSISWDSSSVLNGNHSVTAQATSTKGSATSDAVTVAVTNGGALADAYVTATGNDGNPCSQASPCATFNRGVTVAPNGGTVSVANGSYPFQTLNASKTAEVVVSGESLAGVTVAGCSFGSAQFVTLSNMTINGDCTFPDTSQNHNKLLNTNGSGGSPDILGGSNDTIQGGTWGNCVSGPTSQDSLTGSQCTTRVIGTNQTIDGLTLRDTVGSDEATVDFWHTVGIFFRGCTACTLKNSRLYSHAITNVRIQNCCGLPDNNGITLVNNAFDLPLNITNPAVTTVTSQGALSGTGTGTFSVNSASGFPTVGDFNVIIGGERLTITGGQGTTTWTIGTRGSESTTATSHANGSTVTGEYTTINDQNAEPRHDVIDVDTSTPGLTIAFNSFADICGNNSSLTYTTNSCSGWVDCTGDSTSGGRSGTKCGTDADPADIFANLMGSSSTSGSGSTQNCMLDTAYTYNIQYPFSQFNGTGGPCPGTGNVLTTTHFPYTGARNVPGPTNMAISGGTWAGDNIVPNSVCALFPTDRVGNARGSGGTTCDVGAYER